MDTPFYRRMNSALASKDRSQAKPFFKYLKLCLGGLHKCPLVSGTYTRAAKNDSHPKART